MLLHMWEHTPNWRHSFLSEKQKGVVRLERNVTARLRTCERPCHYYYSTTGAELCFRTSAGAMADLVEAWFARAEGVGAIGDAVRLVAVAALSPVTPAVVQFGV